MKQKYNISKKTVLIYLSYLEDINFIHPVKMYSHSLRAQQVNPVKVYCVDVGLRTATGFYTSDDYGKVAENIVFLGLLQKKIADPLLEIFYWKNPKREVDFLVKHGKKLKELIQVSWDVSEERTRRRERDGLIEAMKEHKIWSGLVITGDVEEEEKISGKRIIYIPLWKWLISNDS